MAGIEPSGLSRSRRSQRRPTRPCPAPARQVEACAVLANSQFHPVGVLIRLAKLAQGMRGPLTLDQREAHADHVAHTDLLGRDVVEYKFSPT